MFVSQGKMSQSFQREFQNTLNKALMDICFPYDEQHLLTGLSDPRAVVLPSPMSII